MRRGRRRRRLPRLDHFDAALVAYTCAILFATFGLTYRYAMWLQRPPTALYWKRGWQTFFRRGFLLAPLVRPHGTDVLANRFIVRRSRLRGTAHLLIMWSCLLAVAITFPLVFGRLHFESMPGDLEAYRVVFGVPAFAFASGSRLGFLVFHGLVWASLLVIAGVMVAMRRCLRDEGAAALQRYAEDVLPLILLFAVSLTGLMLTASYTWMKGYAYTFIAVLHAVTVIATFLWLPFGKLFHIFQRPAQIGVTFYKDAGEADGARARCRRCGAAFISRMHVEDLIEVEAQLGYRYQVDDERVGHYQLDLPALPARQPGRRPGPAGWTGRRGGERGDPVAGRQDRGRPHQPGAQRRLESAAGGTAEARIRQAAELWGTARTSFLMDARQGSTEGTSP